jgi:hypothetical protein
MEIHPLADSPGAHLLVADAGLFSGCRAIFLPSSDPADLPSIQDPSQCATFRSEDADPATENRTLLRLESGTIEVGALGVIASMTGVFERQVGSDVANTETALCSITIDGDRFD